MDSVDDLRSWYAGETKVCSRCGKTKLLTEFNKRSASKDGLTAACRECLNSVKVSKKARREYQLSNKFDIDIAEYNNMFIEQRGCCAICGKTEKVLDTNGKPKWLAVDHNHETNEVRGLLCSKCNIALGLLGDKPENLERALKYLEERGNYGE